MDKMNYSLIYIKCLGNSTTLRNHKSFNDNLFMPSVWKNGILGYWG